MKSIGFIPLRKGSKSIIGKNKKKLLGRPLFSWVLGEAIFSNLKEIYVYTDDEDIIDFINQEYKWTDKVSVYKRSEVSATDTASTEFAMNEFIEQYNVTDFDIFLLLQATSPLTSKEDINNCINAITNEAYDSSLTVCVNKRFYWDTDGNSINYDIFNRPRRQDFNGMLMENGAVYATKKDNLIKTKNRISGKIKPIVMPDDSQVEIDEPEDWVIIEELIKNRVKKRKGLNKIKTLVLDVDGVFTSGNIVYTSDGEFSKEFSLRDGMGFELLRQSNIHVVVMTSENSMIVTKRMEKLKIKDVFLHVRDKYSYLEKYIIDNNLDRSEIAYVGDDINDLANICSVGWSFAPNNALEIVKENADIVLKANGGDMAIRETVGFINKYNERFNGGQK